MFETETLEVNEELETEQEQTNQFIANKLGVDLEAEQALEERITQFNRRQSELITDYLDAAIRATPPQDDMLTVLNGWSGTEKNQNLPGILAADEERKNSGGYYIRWNGKGIVLNPGNNFLKAFHEKGLFMKDIDFVIVTRPTEEGWSDIEKIYTLNSQLNKYDSDFHVIHYYLNGKAHQELTPILKPTFKQERNTVHNLELFVDSPDVEREELAEGITLNFFSTADREGLGIRLDLNKHDASVRVGYISGAAWSPFLSSHLGECDLLLTGFGHTNPSDYGKLEYNEATLGYYGTFTLLDEVKPKLHLCGEFDGSEGDIRMEVIRKFRKEFEEKGETTILPADVGMRVDLKERRITCSVTGSPLDPKDVNVIKLQDSFGKLTYISKESLV